MAVDAGIVVEVGEGDWVGTGAIGLRTELVSEQARPATTRRARTEAIRTRSLGAKLRGAKRAGRNKASNKTIHRIGGPT